MEQHDRGETERRTAQAVLLFVGADRTTGTLVQPYVKNGSDFPVFDAQSWYYYQDNLTRLNNLGVILPGEAPFAGPRRNRDNALARTILTFRDANNVRWVRMPNGTFHPQTRDTVRESVEAILAETPLPTLTAQPLAPELEPNPTVQPDQEQDES